MIIEQKAIMDRGVRKIAFNNLKHTGRFRISKFVLPAFTVICLVLGLGVMLEWGSFLSQVNKGLGIVLLILSGMFLAVDIGSYIYIWHNVKKTADSAVKIGLKYTLNDTGLKVATSVGVNNYTWDEITVEELPAYIKLNVPSKEASFYLKKSELRNKEITWIMTRENEQQGAN